MKIFIDNERNASRRERRSRRECQVARQFARAGFTLIELLTVIAIIGILGAISVSTVRAAIESARATQTRTTIAKVDSVLTSIYEKYQYRRVDVSDYGLPQNAVATDKAWARLQVMRDLLRCDLPRCESEVRTKSQFNGGTSGYTPLQESYLFAIRTIHDVKTAPTEVELKREFDDLNPELLYLILTNAAPECRSTFSDRELADTDGDGLLEIVDGWGKPIRWLRWAPCLPRSDRQPILRVDENGDTVLPSATDDGSDYYEEIYRDRSNADPFDPLSVLAWRRENVSGATLRPGWFLVPYVYSAGSDGAYGIAPDPYDKDRNDDIFNDVNVMNDPFTCLDKGSDYWLGAPREIEGVNAYKDNIDNHTLIR